MQADRYSIMVARLKVALPLMALGLLSTLFLVSRAVDPTVAIPFADQEVQDRLKNQQITGPFFSGVSARGDQIAFVADIVTTKQGQFGANAAEDVTVKVDLASGTYVTIEAQTALIDILNDRSEMEGDVQIVTSDGYELRAPTLNMRLSVLDVEAPNGVTAQTPMGDLEAGTMRLFESEDNNDTQLLFTNGVKLLYHLKK